MNDTTHLVEFVGGPLDGEWAFYVSDSVDGDESGHYHLSAWIEHGELTRVYRWYSEPSGVAEAGS